MSIKLLLSYSNFWHKRQPKLGHHPYKSAIFVSFHLKNHVWFYSNILNIDVYSILFVLVWSSLTFLNLVPTCSTLLIQPCSPLFNLAQFHSTFFNIAEPWWTSHNHENLDKPHWTLLNLYQPCWVLPDLVHHTQPHSTSFSHHHSWWMSINLGWYRTGMLQSLKIWQGR